MLSPEQQIEIIDSLVQTIYVKTGIELNASDLKSEIFSDKIIVSLWNHFYSMIYYHDYDYDHDVIAEEIFEKSVNDPWSNVIYFKIEELRKFLPLMSDLVRARLMREGMNREHARNLVYDILEGEERMKRIIPEMEEPVPWGYPQFLLHISDFEKFDFLYELTFEDQEKPYNPQQLIDQLVEYFHEYSSDKAS